MLLTGWSLIEGVGTAPIMLAIVALVASNFASDKRSAVYGLVAAAAAMAVAAGPLFGGAVTTHASWRYVFVGELVRAVSKRRVAGSNPSCDRLCLPINSSRAD